MKADAEVDPMLARLRQLYAQDEEERLFGNILRRIEDPLRPRNEDGRFRVNPILLLLAVLAALALGVFVFFSLSGGL